MPVTWKLPMRGSPVDAVDRDWTATAVAVLAAALAPDVRDVRVEDDPLDLVPVHEPPERPEDVPAIGTDPLLARALVFLDHRRHDLVQSPEAAAAAALAL